MNLVLIDEMNLIWFW